MNPLRDRNFRLLWIAGLISETGDWLLLASLPILIFQLTGSALGTAVAFLVELAPGILLSPLAGYLADRWDRRRALTVIALVQAAGLLPLLALHDVGDLWIGYTVTAFQAALVTLFEPTKNALMPTLVRPIAWSPPTRWSGSTRISAGWWAPRWAGCCWRSAA